MSSTGFPETSFGLDEKLERALLDDLEVKRVGLPGGDGGGSDESGELLSRYRGQRIGLVDAFVAVVAERLGIERIQHARPNALRTVSNLEGDPSGSIRADALDVSSRIKGSA